jgi:hypothetical protein
VTRDRSTALAGIGAALLSNYWVLEWWLADRTDTPTSWISDIATRTEASGWRFQLLAILSGLAIAAFALLLLRVVAITPAHRDERRPPGPGRRMLRWGLVALLASGAFVAGAGAAPLSCPEGIEPSCSLAEDPLDVVHALATGGEIIATLLAFLLLGLALLPPGGRPFGRIASQRSASPGGAGRVTLGIGAVWLLLTAATGLAYVSGDVDAAKGVLQRSAQVLFGTWLALLGLWFSRGRA